MGPLMAEGEDVDFFWLWFSLVIILNPYCLSTALGLMATPSGFPLPIPSQNLESLLFPSLSFCSILAQSTDCGLPS